MPGLVDPSIGYTTGYTVNGSVTLTATGGWTEIVSGCPSLACIGPNGTGSPLAGENQANWLLPGGSAFILAGRIGTSGPWSAVGAGPTTLHGNGAHLYMAMNDRLPSYADNGGSLHVTATDPLQLTTAYSSDGPVLAGAPVDWEGTVANTNATNIGATQAVVSLGRTPTVGVPTWSIPANESSGACTPSEGDVYLCNFGTVPAHSTAFIDATADTTGVGPGNHQRFALGEHRRRGFVHPPRRSHTKQSTACNSTCWRLPPSPRARCSSSRRPSRTRAQPTRSATSSCTDRSTTARTTRARPTPRSTTAAEGGPTIDCPTEETGYALPPGESLDFTTTVNTNGLAGESIDWSMLANSPDLNGDTQTESGSVAVVSDTGAAAPTVSIVAPASNVKLGQTLAHPFTATASPASGQSISYVDLRDRRRSAHDRYVVAVFGHARAESTEIPGSMSSAPVRTTAMARPH